MITANELMTPRPIVVQSTDRVRDAVQVLRDHDVRHVPVIDEKEELVGMVSDRDLRGLTLPERGDVVALSNVSEELEAPISSLMTGEPLSVGPETDAREIVDLMLNHKIGAVPVVDADDHLVGIVSYVDLLRELSID